MGALDRARIALAEANLASELSSIVQGVDGIKRAMGAFNVSAAAKRQADELFLRAVHGLGMALRREYPSRPVAAIVRESGFKMLLISAALSITSGKPLATFIKHFENLNGSALTTIYAVGLHLNRPADASPPEERVPITLISDLAHANDWAEAMLRNLTKAAQNGITEKDRAKLRVLRSSAALAVEAVDLLLKGERSRAVALLLDASLGE